MASPTIIDLTADTPLDGDRQTSKMPATTKSKQAKTAPSDGIDRLTTLPSELQHMIFDYLFCRHMPDKAFFGPGKSEHKTWRNGPCSQPLDMVAATSKVLRAEVNDWATSLLIKHKDATNFEVAKTTKKDRTFNMLRGAKGLLNWSEKHCVFCGKKSVRGAILINGLKCCADCDKVQWPDKLTKTTAKDKYDLKDYHLFKRFVRSTAPPKFFQQFPNGLPRLHYGTYISSGVPTTIFLKKEVDVIATMVHGDLETHLEKRKLVLEERKRKRSEKRKADAEAQEAAEEASKRARIARREEERRKKRSPCICNGANPECIVDDYYVREV